MLTRRFLATAVAAVAFVAASGGARAAERSLMGIVLGRSYRQVLAKFGSPNQVQPVVIPVPGQAGAGGYDANNPGAPSPYGGAPGYGAPGGAMPGGYPGAPASTGGPPGGAPSYGAPASTGG